MDVAQHDDLLELLNMWASLFGWTSGRIDVDRDMSACLLEDCTLTVHAPMWGTREGQEQVVPADVVRRRLAWALWFVHIERHQMHLAWHPDGRGVCLFFLIQVQVRGVPWNLATVPIAFIMRFVDTAAGPRVAEIHERSAATTEEARRVLVDQCGWPDTTRFVSHVAFGAVS
jgi:hypothetical protein